MVLYLTLSSKQPPVRFRRGGSGGRSEFGPQVVAIRELVSTAIVDSHAYATLFRKEGRDSHQSCKLQFEQGGLWHRLWRVFRNRI